MKQYFDILIAMLIIITAYPAVILLFSLIKRPNSWEAKHKKTTLTLSILLILGALTIIYGSFIEPQLLVVNKQEIDLPNIEKSIKIAFIADFQAGPYRQIAWVEKVAKTIQTLNPNIVLIGGDQVDNSGTWKDETGYLSPLAELPKHAPTFAIHGNHEYGVGTNIMIAFENKRLPDVSHDVELSMSKMGIDYLTNELRLLSVNDQKFYLFGGDSSEAGKLNFSELKNRNLDIPTIGLLHDPRDIITANSYNIDLMLSGHTHGGQIRLPFLGPLGRIDTLTPTSWYKGWSKYNKTDFFVTSGVGESGARSRLFNPPEIVLLTIK